jgi:FHS family L-fucose permease-like MFS transporter
MQTARLSSEPWFKLSALSAVYLVWGAIASLNDLLIPYLKSEFGLNFSGALRIQLVFYTAYFLLSIPCGMLARRYGYRNGVLTGLSIAITGCLAMIAASQAGSYAVVLGAVFILASGITLLQVSANPFATSLGPVKTAPSRLTLVQSFHSLGTTIGPWFGAILIFSLAATTATDALPGTPGRQIWLPYAILATMLAGLVLLFSRIPPGDARSSAAAGKFNPLNLVRTNRRLLPGTIGIFCYVGAEIAIASLLVNYLVRTDIAGLGYVSAGKLVSVYWGCALVGRFVGVGLLRRFQPDRLLAVYATMAALLLATTMSSSGNLATGSVLLIGFFNSIMFPTIFALTIQRSPAADGPGASGVLCLGIVGGAVIPQLQGILADSIGIQASFALPLLCYAYIVFLAITILKPVNPE